MGAGCQRVVVLACNYLTRTMEILEDRPKRSSFRYRVPAQHQRIRWSAEGEQNPARADRQRASGIGGARRGELPAHSGTPGARRDSRRNSPRDERCGRRPNDSAEGCSRQASCQAWALRLSRFPFFQGSKVVQPDPERFDAYRTHAGQRRGDDAASASQLALIALSSPHLSPLGRCELFQSQVF